MLSFQFKRDPAKMMSIVGWMVVSGDPSQPDSFTLTQPSEGHVYKFRTSTRTKALEWCRHLDKATKADLKKVK